MDINSFHKEIPTYDNGIWTETIFDSRDEFKAFLESLFKEPGKYEFDDTSLLFNEQARLFDKNGYYCAAPFKTKDFFTYWNLEKKKSTEGVIFKHDDKTWYLTRDYYFWINFLPIYDKIKKNFDFPQVWDVQYHMALYECLAEVNFKHAVITKKRQIASSYFHCAKLINKFWFDAGAILKMGASLKKYVNLEGSWKYLEEYRNFLNKNTAWIRPLNPAKEGNWQQKIEIEKNGVKVTVGLKSVLLMTSFEKSETSSVGGPCSYFFMEEAGIAPKMDKTYIYLKSALEMGDMTTGQFIAAGSVGELKDCEPLKEFMLNPEVNGFMGVKTDLIDDNHSVGVRGLFIPEQWGMPPYIDQYGNSLVEQALKALNERFEKLKKDKDPATYQLEVSQHPRNIQEAFAYRNINIFPTNLIEEQTRAIEDKDFPYEIVDLFERANGEIIVSQSSHSPIKQFPVKMDSEDKQGAIQVWERPSANPQYNEYVASIDPVRVDQTTTSVSLCSIYVYKMPVHVQRKTVDGTENSIEGDKIVCCWVGRFNELEETHKRLELILKWYKCRALCEANVAEFINYMMKKNLAQRYLIHKSEMIFLKEYSLNNNTFQEYGWKNTGDMFRRVMIPLFISWLNEVVDEEIDEEGNVRKKIYGIRRIPDIMVMKEMAMYNPDLNVDRLISVVSLVCYVKIQMANQLIATRTEYNDDDLEKNKNLYKLKISPFKTNQVYKDSRYNVKRSQFRKLW